ncbi:PaaI family thioesterase [Streptomyces sp. ODS28]|uniref:PaaI family thioesterase n=1 Tax=Streptomyces sp. ODS28 TaxID=3136688 RepID=UPI0031F01358
MADGRFDHWNKERYAEIGLELTHAEPDQVTMTWTPTPATHNFAGGVDGGVIAMVLDQVCCTAAATRTAQATAMVTLSLNIDFTRAPRTGQPHAVRGELVHAGRHRMLTNGHVYDSQGRTVAQAVGAIVPGDQLATAQPPGED